MLKRWFFLVLALGLSSAAGVLAHVRLINPSNGNPLFWATPSNIGIVINSTGSDNIGDDSDEVAIRLAIQEWNSATGSSVQLVENVNSSQQARTDWTNGNIHLVLFDEVNSSGYFPTGSGTVAITPIMFFGNGRIADADILFNGKGFNFTTSQQAGRYDVGDVVAHELGHLVGLDHSAQAGSTLYPYVDPSVILHRSLSDDDVTAMRVLSPAAAFGSISGSVRRASNNTVLRGAHVVARNSEGRTSASVLTNSAGNFTLPGLLPETYQVYVMPLGTGGLDAPVTAGNFGGGFTIETDFEGGFFPGNVTITSTESDSLGTLLMDPDVSLNLGSAFDRYPIRVNRGQSTTITLRGIGLNPSSVLTAGDSDLIVGTPMFFGSQVSFQLTVPANEAAGNVDMMVTNLAGEISVLSGALEITPPSPTVATVSPILGSMGGGTTLTLTGSNFNPGTRVVIGDQIYIAGIGSTVLVNSGTLQLTTNATPAGAKDVVVIDATGVEGRKLSAFSFASVPQVQNVFPSAGFSGGGTLVTLTGQDFLPGIHVRINGVDQGTPNILSSSQMSFTSNLGSVGVQVLEIEGAGGMTATSLFTYQAQVDPVLSGVAPAQVPMAGGTTLTLTGSNFSSDSEVWLGADASSGLGGTQVTGVTVLDSNTIEITAPVFATAGAMSVMVMDASSSQTGILGAALTVTSPGGSGGGCYMVPLDGGSGPRDVLLGSWWLLLVLGFLLWRAQRMQPGAQAQRI